MVQLQDDCTRHRPQVPLEFTCGFAAGAPVAFQPAHGQLKAKCDRRTPPDTTEGTVP